MEGPGSEIAGCGVLAGWPTAAARVGHLSACWAAAVVELEGSGGEGAGLHAGSKTENRSGGSGVDRAQLAAVGSATGLALTMVAGLQVG